MHPLFEELDYCPTPIGAISLRRRMELVLKREVYEIKLDDEFLMSSLFTESEIALGRLGLAACEGTAFDVIVGGLGLGYTAQAVLENNHVASLGVVEMLVPVIDWHQRGLLPLGPELVADSRCEFLQGDFFELVASEQGFDPGHPARRYDAILLDIDHSPEALLDERSSNFYQPEGLRGLARHLKPHGIFGLWSNDAPDPAFTERLASIFAEAWAEPVTFDNPLLGRPFTQSVYLARVGA